MNRARGWVLATVGVAAVIALVSAVMKSGKKDAPQSGGATTQEVMEPGGGTPGVEAPVVPRTFEEIYGLNGLSAKRVKPPFEAAREVQLKAAGMWNESIPNGAVSMIVEWRENGPWIRTAVLGGPGMSLDELINHFLGYRDMDIEAVNRLKFLRMTGDFLFDQKSSKEERIAALEQFVLDEHRMRIMIREVEVDETVYVLKGKWKYTAIPDIPWPEEEEKAPTLEIYGVSLDKDLAGRKAYGYGSIGQLAGVVGYFIQRTVVIEAEGAPERVRFFYNYKGDGVPENRAMVDTRSMVHDPELTLQHICEQTGLTKTTMVRQVKKVRIVEGKADVLP